LEAIERGMYMPDVKKSKNTASATKERKDEQFKMLYEARI
jgi:hypothetical protein